MKFQEDFEKMWSRIFVRKIPTCFARYADGEYAIINGIPIGPHQAIDGWESPASISKLGNDLKATLQHSEESYFYGLPSPSQNKGMFDMYKSIIPQDESRLTYSDLWVNSNYRNFYPRIRNIEEDIVLFASEKTQDRLRMVPFNLVQYYPISPSCVDYWEEHSQQLLDWTKDAASKFSNTLFLISAGPLSEVIIDAAFKTNPSNRYVDVGSAIDELTHGKKTRPYMHVDSPYFSDAPQW